MEVTLRGYVPTAMQFVGMTIAVVGSIFMALDLKQLCKKKEDDSDFQKVKENK